MLPLFLVLAVPALLAGLWSVRAGLRQLAALRRPGPPDWTPPASLIVPVKGLDHQLRENLRSLAEQDYPDYELLIVARDAGDPAVGHAPPGARVILAGPGDLGSGEKVNNLLAGVVAARPSSVVFAFADSDGRVHPGWLRALVAPLQNPQVGACTGYRWYFPGSGGWWSLLRSAWNAVIFGGFGAGRPAFAWGGAMAVRKETFEAARIADYWKGSVSDDYRLTAAVRAAGLEIRFAPGAMVASLGECGAREFLSWAVRQMIITKVYAPRLWLAGLAAHALYCGAQVAGLAAAVQGQWWTLGVLALLILPGVVRAELRRRAARLLFPERAPWPDGRSGAYLLSSLPTTWIWLYTFVASAFTRTIEWRGCRYRLDSPSRTRRLN